MMKAVIFDLDGVLVFTDQYHYRAWKEMADKLGIYFDEEINNRLRGVSRRESLEIILERYEGEPLTEEQIQEYMTFKNNRYRELLTEMSPADVAPEVRTCLVELREKGYKLAIGSSSKNAKFILEKTDLTAAFDAVSDGTNISQSKPHPEVFLKAAQYLGVDPDVSAVIEDAKAGIDAAVSGGMYAIGIGDASDYAACDASIKSLAELPALLENLV